ncbi:GTP pyrophosphokinase family protein [Paenibacillus sp. PsM32]|uniref:GTP pyrophosphokinase family protein n=1 Tax=Paenibacillus kyungheensis TaxID=1452732 RepID=A0AAX3M2B0_9BACL|nr:MULTISPECIES: GTP pyrophosphokinase family protein [Paenibacillus]MDN4619433.1 GTP pyrophosphokinase family protein [Paenibacillus sp. PsM32]WCT56390.1 GTP pyrophosphokinase family protein [Paenibacillus kyungheensis]WDF50492.1 GTP pyrophosphokinase family protein [Paenibacillus sp. KACC 21273]
MSEIDKIISLNLNNLDLSKLKEISEHADTLKQFEEWKKLPILYELALEELQNKIKLIQAEWELTDGFSPIEHIKTRLKDPKSMIEKLVRKGLDTTVDNIFEHIHDIAGMRIVCAFVQDIYRMFNHLQQREDIKIIEIKDYIANPKSNGYQSLHVIVAVPLVLMEGKRWVKVEIQMRTLAMDFWASLEHIIFYKYDKQVPAHIVHELTEAAKAADELDLKMLNLRKEVLSLDDSVTPPPPYVRKESTN